MSAASQAHDGLVHGEDDAYVGGDVEEVGHEAPGGQVRAIRDPILRQIGTHFKVVFFVLIYMCGAEKNYETEPLNEFIRPFRRKNSCLFLEFPDKILMKNH